MTVLGQLVTVAPTDASNWLRLARTVLQIRPRDDREKALLLDRASTAAYIAYQRATARDLEADSLAVLGKTLADRKQWRPALDSHAACARSARERRPARPIRAAAQRIRLPHAGLLGRFRRRSRRASASSSRKNCLASAPISRPSWRSPARTSRRSRPTTSSFASKASSTASATRSRCAPGCRRRCARRWRSRPTSPSSCATASRSCASPARPMCCRAPASAAFRCSASTPARSMLSVYRIGDRNLLDTVLGYDFQRNLSQYEAERLASERGAKVWSGELAVDAQAQYRSRHRVPGRPGARRTQARRLRR